MCPFLDLHCSNQSKKLSVLGKYNMKSCYTFPQKMWSNDEVKRLDHNWYFFFSWGSVISSSPIILDNLCLKIVKNELEEVRTKLDQEPNFDLRQFGKNGFAPIHFVRSCKMLEILQQHGVDIDVRSQNKKSMTPLQLSIKVGNDELRDCLLEAKANVNIKDSGNRTAIVNCIETQNADCVKKILPKVENK